MAERMFSDLLRDDRGGVTDLEVTKAVRELVAAVETTGKAGAITVTVALRPNCRGQVYLQVTPKAKLPELPREASLYFVDGDLDLTRQDPRQLSLRDLRDPGEDPGPGDRLR